MTNPMKSTGILVFVFMVFVLTACSDDENLFTPPTYTPPDVSGLNAVTALRVENDATLWGTINLIWSEPDANTRDLAVEFYQVAIDENGGTIDRYNWYQMKTLLTVIPDGATTLEATFDNTDANIFLGSSVSVAVRPFYETGLAGPVGSSLAITPEAAHVHSGYVRDEYGNPLSDVTVSLVDPVGIDDPRGLVSVQVTDANGYYGDLGPIRQSVPMVLATTSLDVESAPGAEDAYFDYRTETIAYNSDSAEHTITLVTRIELSANSDRGGLNLINMVQRFTHSNHTHNYRLHKWESYPVKVYIPDFTSPNGMIEMDEVVREAVAIWNSVLIITPFVETADSTTAQIRVKFSSYSNHTYGYVFQDNSPYVNGAPGFITPNSMTLYLSPALEASEGYMLTAAKHELGHTLSYYGHNVEYPSLMGLGMSADAPTEDEIRVTNVVMGLPNLTLMSYFVDSIYYPFE